MRPVIIGGGHNGLVAAFTLARAGLRPIVIERRPQVGGGAITTEILPGFRCPTLSHDAGLFSRDLAQTLELERHGAELLAPSTAVFAPAPDGRAILLDDDVQRSAESLRLFSARDAAAYPEFRRTLARLAAVLASVLGEPPPDVDAFRAGALWSLMSTARAFRALGRRDAYRLLRWGPMPIADLLHEWFETELLCSALAGPGVSGTAMGPRSAGSSLVMLMRESHRGRGIAGQVRGGPGALTQAIAAAARGAGAEIRTGVGATHIVVKDERVAGVVLNDGSEVAAQVVLSGADPKTTMLRLLDPFDLSPDVLTKVQNYRSRGTMAKINFALSSLPRFDAAGAHDDRALAGRIHIGPDLDYLEKAFDHSKYGELSPAPWLDVRIPSIADPSLAPAGGHVMSVYVHCAPYALREGAWESKRAVLLDAVTRTLSEYAPGLGRLIAASEVITPADLEREYGYFGGHPFHGELAADQLYAMRPFLGYGSYLGPVEGLYLCGAGTHPGGFMTGLSGRFAAERVLRDLKR